MESLRRSWDALCGRSGLRGGAALWKDLMRRYSEPHRVYHGPAHLAQVIGLLETMQAPDELLFAAWYHDAVYQPGRGDNEARSALLAAECLRQGGYGADAAAVVHAAILATASHRAESRFAALLDADLAILGAPATDYAAYRAAIRREYASVPEPAFRNGRLAFVRAMLAREAIYQTPHCWRLYEAAARVNLDRERAELEAVTETVPCS